MENLFDKGEMDKAWDRLESFEQESRARIYDAARHQWESRMNYLAARILLRRNDLERAESVIRENLDSVRRTQSKKREGSLLRLLGEVNLRRMEFDHAFSNIHQSISLLKEVGNPRQIWEAHSALGRAFDQTGRSSEARDHWRAAAEIIQKTANGLSERDIREGFLKAAPVREVFSKVQL
jgi:tetratricopeptide (TPR) repeat protein